VVDVVPSEGLTSDALLALVARPDEDDGNDA
jgi:hypothetical protein